MSRRVVIPLVGVALVVAVAVLREQTMTRHVPGIPGTATEVVLDAATRNPLPSATTTELTQALVLTCRLEVEAEPKTDLQAQPGAGRYRILLAPALDEFDERQLHGCLEDARINHLQVEVVHLGRPTGDPAPGSS